MKLNPLPPSMFHVVVCVGVYWRIASKRMSCTSPEEGVKMGTAQPGCWDEVARTRFSQESTNPFCPAGQCPSSRLLDRKSTRLNSSHPSISYAVFCLKKKKISTDVVNT